MTIAEVSKQYGLSQDTLRYYERVGMIPPVTRTAGGIRDYQEEDLGWVELAKCMRSAGLPVESLIEYVKLFREGDNTIEARRNLLAERREELLEQNDTSKRPWNCWTIRSVAMRKLCERVCLPGQRSKTN